MSGQPKLIVVVGSLNMDLVLNVPRIPAPGETLSGRTLTFVPGGKGANQAVACARLGGRVAMIGRVGADEFGTQLRRGLERDGVGLEHVGVDDSTSTGAALIMVESSAQNRIVVVPGANSTLTAAHVEAAAELIDSAALMILQLEIPLPTVERAIARAVRAGVRVLLNPAPAQELPEALLEQVDYLIPNETEALLLTSLQAGDPEKTYGAAANLLQRRGARAVLITLGAQGVLVADERGVRRHIAPAVTAIDTTAAGDTFVGGFAVGLVEGMETDAAVQFAMRAAAVSVTRVGAQTSIPYRSEL